MADSITFEFATATRILFGSGRLKDLGAISPGFGQRCFLVRGSRAGPSAGLITLLMEFGVEVMSFSISGEPNVNIVEDGLLLARQHRADFVIGIGGGSVLDAGKAISILLTNEGSIYDYLEVIGQGKPFTRPAVPYIAIPTTAGTGTEVTRNAVIGSPEHRVKVSLRSPYMLPRLALIDPLLTSELPPAIIASSGLDALTQLIEPYTSNAPNPLTDAICKEGISRIAKSFWASYETGEPDARADMSIAALFSGLALANARLGAVHGFAGVLGGLLQAPHGAICARLLPVVMRMNIQKLMEENYQPDCLHRYDEVAQILVGDHRARALDGVKWVEETCSAMKIPGLGNYGLIEQFLPDVIEKSAKASSMRGNIVPLTSQDMWKVLAAAL
jgi:alcohol dehydrogenase class IV